MRQILLYLREALSQLAAFPENIKFIVGPELENAGFGSTDATNIHLPHCFVPLSNHVCSSVRWRLMVSDPLIRPSLTKVLLHEIVLLRGPADGEWWHLALFQEFVPPS